MGDDCEIDPERWVERHGDYLFRFALLRVREPDRAADLVQETFVEALRSRGSFTGRSSERTWLVAILKHKVIDRIRKQAREPARSGGDAAEVAESGDFTPAGHWT